MKSLFLISIRLGGNTGGRAKVLGNPLQPHWLRTDPANDRSAQPGFGVKSWGSFRKLVTKIFATKDQGLCRTSGSDRLAEPILLRTRQLHRLRSAWSISHRAVRNLTFRRKKSQPKASLPDAKGRYPFCNDHGKSPLDLSWEALVHFAALVADRRHRIRRKLPSPLQRARERSRRDGPS
jgi:hypothetical protein